ncbi:serine hydrolase domain-containing protein [Microbulbifer spongiae]|uniref:Beta-lactamase family protein n=1 Tax=Microbulbifer spongiae TaxID=2944933 RepID=A0ABY9EAE4_9GAMM|nr:serine hydrolase domain-containing protein [Microbulbifer sp. MI-G]WKD48871.1 beta-lactamase family protein [Microbulbifer sp. MI-G]
MKRILVVLIVIGLSNFASSAEKQLVRLDGSTISSSQLTNKITQLTNAAQVQGLTVTVFNNGLPVYSEAFGFADLPNKKPLKTTTEMYGASLSKAVFAVLVMKLADQGIIDLDKPLQSYLKEPLWKSQSDGGNAWHKNLGDLRQAPRYRKITARMCLSHTTGLPNWRWFESDHKLRIHFEPGERYSYSAEGMVLLQVVLEKLTGKSVEQLMRETIFIPYGMAMSSYTWQPRFERDYALGHGADGNTFPRDKDNAARAPSTLETTTQDYMRFMTAVLKGDGISAKALKEMFSPQVRIRTKTQFGPGAGEITDRNDDIQLSYGLGWGLFHTKYGWAAFKEGHHDEGFQNFSMIYPEMGTGVLLMSNSNNAEGIFGYLLSATIAEQDFPMHWEGFIPYDQKPPE